MGVREQCRDMVLQGVTPGQITKQRGVTYTTVVAYLNEMIGRRELRRSDVLITISREIRLAISKDGTESVSAVRNRLTRQKISANVEDIDTAIRFGGARNALGEMYEDLRAIEVLLHNRIRASLESEFGSGERGWWRKGVPSNIRAECQKRREDDEDPVDDPYNYTDLVDLREIIKKNWPTVGHTLPIAVAKDQRQLLADLVRLNVVRRNVMHPVRGSIPSDEDFDFVREFRARLGEPSTADRLRHTARGLATSTGSATGD